MLRKIGLILVVLVMALLVFAATKPDTFTVQRMATINAPADSIYPHIIDFRRWNAWSPWERLDPSMRKSISGAPSGKGAVYAWQGNSDVGQGRMEITEANPPSKVEIKLDFTEPWESTNQTVFTLEPMGNATNVTWTMQGPNQYLGKLMSVFVDMDKMIGKDFERGLTSLKAISEKRAGR